ncbi:cytosolic iron-sulfur assembly 1 [Lecanosticta acicola]|uniref:Probable cytosolic iron-sulfur protein assembly protein 1 n=1 Tax=Lecanosticta acicola TaxID=111012 RepID=A0AAI8Z835_9PEZI|nr:cytosolic iron-sulfur assembly 1 [Lecanosticta acicola]
MPPPPSSSTLTPLATLSPPCNARTWMSTPHPHLPILATACADKTVRIYSLTDFAQQGRSIEGGHKRSIRSCCWKDTGSRNSGSRESVLATGSFDASAGIWRRDEDGGFEGGGGGGGGERERDFTGRGLAGGESGGEEEEEWRLEVILDGHDSEIKSLAFCPTAPLLATCSRDKSVWIWEELDGDNFETMAVLQDHDGDVKCVAWHPREALLASGSYDDCVRLWREDVDDWGCCALLQGHEGTVWWVEFEGEREEGSFVAGASAEWVAEKAQSGARLMTCSDDRSIRVWRRRPKAKSDMPTGQGRMPSIWKNSEFQEEWFEEARLPLLHDRPVYAISWSRKSGRVVSAGSDGKILVYEERWRGKEVEMSDAPPPADGETHGCSTGAKSLTEWVLIAEVENAHDVFEVNHVVWAPRADKGKRSDDEEVIVSTGDDGEVKVWILEG